VEKARLYTQLLVIVSKRVCILGSSFLFDRNIPDRRSPLKLFSTIAHDLFRLSNNLAVRISQALKDGRSVASAGQTRQFKQLILKILRNQVPKLPGSFRFLITSRPTDEIRTDLLSVDHIRYGSLDIYGNINQRDYYLVYQGQAA
jgi:hypothetical protein